MPIFLDNFNKILPFNEKKYLNSNYTAFLFLHYLHYKLCKLRNLLSFYGINPTPFAVCIFTLRLRQAIIIRICLRHLIAHIGYKINRCLPRPNLIKQYSDGFKLCLKNSVSRSARARGGTLPCRARGEDSQKLLAAVGKAR